ncbi:MAG TPA: hypothetical protein VN580_10760 [Clostridia bacterium]|nr:hypothetical protein [Clostridia bacterium]
MNSGKKLYISITAAVIAVFYAWFVILDFSRFGSLDFTYDIPPGGLLKRIDVLLAASIAWVAGADGLSMKDGGRMKLAFVFACLGEAAFVFRVRGLGLAMFAVCQTMLAARNSRSFRRGFGRASGRQKKKLLAAGIIVFLVFAGLPISAAALTGFNSAVAAVCFYWSILNISLLAGTAGYILGLLPERNAVLACAGVICFYCCDVLVGLDAALEPGLPWLLANSFIWVFYIPALVLLAFSCYRYD